MNGLWQRAGDRMRDELGQVGFETWIGPLNFVAHQGSTVTVEAPNRFFRDWINDRYMSLMRSALSAEAGGEIEVRLTLGENAAIAPQQHRPSNGHANGDAMAGFRFYQLHRRPRGSEGSRGATRSKYPIGLVPRFPASAKTAP